MNLFTRQLSMSPSMKNGLRGSLIVLEGCDRSGKSTQCAKLMERLKQDGRDVKLLKFPDRETPIGKMIDAYLKQSTQLEDHTIHLLFSVNRWENIEQMKDLLLSGTTLIVDRYSFSGVAYTAAKGLDLNWCKQPEKGLIKPDRVLYIDVGLEKAMARSDFGQERYEKLEFQRKVRDVFHQLKEPSYWTIVNGESSIDQVHEEVYSIASKVIEEVATYPLSSLWADL